MIEELLMITNQMSFILTVVPAEATSRGRRRSLWIALNKGWHIDVDPGFFPLSAPVSDVFKKQSVMF